MGFLDGLFKKEPLLPEQERRNAIRKARQHIAKLNAKAAKLTAEYDKLREEAKEHLKAGNRGMAKEAARRCCVLKADIARYEKLAAAAQAMLDTMLDKMESRNRWWDEGVMDPPRSTIVLPPGYEYEREVAVCRRIDEITASLSSDDDAALSEEEQLERRECVEKLLRELEQELAMEAGAADGSPRDEATDMQDADPERRDEVSDMVLAGTARLKKLLEEFPEEFPMSAGTVGESRWLRPRPTERLADVAGLEDVKQALRDMVIDVFNKLEAYEGFNRRPYLSALLYGPPGTGKTMLARAVAGELDAAFFHANGRQMRGKYVGETEKNITMLFEEARKHERSIIFIDECDALLSRTGNQKVNSITQFLTMIDGFEKSGNLTLLLLATNKPESLDTAVFRYYRLRPPYIYIGPPDKAARRAIVEAQLKDAPLVVDFPFAELAEATEGYSGADIKELCDRMKLSVVRRWPVGSPKITADDAKAALDTVKPSITPEMIQHYKDWAAKFVAGWGEHFMMRKDCLILATH